MDSPGYVIKWNILTVHVSHSIAGWIPLNELHVHCRDWLAWLAVVVWAMAENGITEQGSDDLSYKY